MKHKIVPRIGVIVLKNNSFLAVQHNRKGELFWVLPGGGVELGETIDQCAVREVKEETGLIVLFKKLLYVHDYIYEGEHIINIFVLASLKGGTLNVGKDPERKKQVIQDARFIRIKMLKDMPFYPELLKKKLIKGLPNQGSYLGSSL